MVMVNKSYNPNNINPHSLSNSLSNNLIIDLKDLKPPYSSFSVASIILDEKQKKGMTENKKKNIVSIIKSVLPYFMDSEKLNELTRVVTKNAEILYELSLPKNGEILTTIYLLDCGEGMYGTDQIERLVRESGRKKSSLFYIERINDVYLRFLYD